MLKLLYIVISLLELPFGSVVSCELLFFGLDGFAGGHCLGSGRVRKGLEKEMN